MPAEEQAILEKPRKKEDRAIEILEEALGGQSGKSKNTLIKDAIKILRAKGA